MDLADINVDMMKIVREANAKIEERLRSEGIDTAFCTWRIKIEMTDGYVQEEVTILEPGQYANGEPKELRSR